MTPTIIKNVKGKDIPTRWMRNIRKNPGQTFTLIITPETTPGADTEICKSVSEKNRIFDMLEGEAGCESSEEWIALIKSGHKENRV